MQEIKKTDLFGSQKNAFANAEVLLPQKRGRKSQAIKPGANAEEPEELKFDEYGNKIGPLLNYSPHGYGDFSPPVHAHTETNPVSPNLHANRNGLASTAKAVKENQLRKEKLRAAQEQQRQSDRLKQSAFTSKSGFK
jgi:hypothetical protein